MGGVGVVPATFPDSGAWSGPLSRQSGKWRQGADHNLRSPLTGRTRWFLDCRRPNQLARKFFLPARDAIPPGFARESAMDLRPHDKPPAQSVPKPGDAVL